MMHLPTTQGASAFGVWVVRQQAAALQPICDETFMFFVRFMEFRLARSN
jgi:hypothetical protein